MAAKTQYVTIPLEEYKRLLLKEAPSDKGHEVGERLLAMLEQHVEYDEHDSKYWTDSIGDHMKAKNDGGFIVEAMTMLKYVDFDRYMEIWNKTQTAERNRKAIEAQIEQMNEAKEIRSEARQ